MALKHHTDDQARYDQQVDNSRSYVMPFIEATRPVIPGIAVLEIGCGEGGVLKPFIEKGAYCVGVDLDKPRIDLANNFLKEEVAAGKAEFILQNVYEENFLKRFDSAFDIIILKDAIEHIPEQEKFIPYLRNFLKQGGIIFFGFPPWYMPFGGHQQVAYNKWLSKIPWTHILPKAVYKGLIKMAGEPQNKVDELMEIRDTRITIERFERIVAQSGMIVKKKQHFLINPIYKYKFGLQPRKQLGLISLIPYVRDFLTTCVYYTVA